MRKKIPIIAAILNFLLVGLGYLYTGRKKVFGILLLVYAVLAFLTPFVPLIQTPYTTFALGTLFALAIAYDGLQDALEYNENLDRKKKTKSEK